MADKRYVWIVDGEPEFPVVGTLADYAHDWEYSRYGDVALSPHVWLFDTGEPVQQIVIVRSEGTDDRDYLYYSLTVADETVCARVDGRS